MKRFLRPALYATLFLLPLAAFAADSQFVPLLPSLPGIQSLESANSTAAFFSQLYKICIGIAAVLAVLQIMRAGVMYMGGDSITEKKEARDLIAMSVVGLLLVLSPVIVFSIINPRILNLDINAGQLETSITPPAQDAAATQEAGDGTCSFNCTAGNTCQQGKCVAVQASGSCSAIANGATITADQFACCQKQPGYSVKTSVSAGTNDGLATTAYTCVAPPAPPPAPTYGWRASLVKSDGSGLPSTQGKGPFPTQQQCFDSYTSYTQQNGLALNANGTFQCSCNTPLSQQPSCTGF